MIKYKLNLDLTQIRKPNPEMEKINCWASPHGWWNVTTEGDEEGRTTVDLGTYPGHVAEIALHLADKCFYSLCFRPVRSKWSSGIPSVYVATRLSVNVSFGNNPSLTNYVDCPFNQQSPDFKKIEKWMEAEGVRISPSNYFGAVILNVG